jgi:hypothetical protein
LNHIVVADKAGTINVIPTYSKISDKTNNQIASALIGAAINPIPTEINVSAMNDIVLFLSTPF